VRNRTSRALAWVLLGVVIAGCDQAVPPRGQFEPQEVTLKEISQSGLKELTGSRLMFVDSQGTQWIAPVGTWTDGASVPRLALPLTNGQFQSEFLKAAIVHDAYCQECNADRCPEQYRKRTWQQVHTMFHEACLAGGTSPLEAKLMFAAVWLCGPRWDDPDTNRQEVSDEALARAFGGCKNWIAQKDPAVNEIVADLGERETLLPQLHQLESQSAAALQEADWDKADALLQKEEALLAEKLSQSPDDVMLLNYRGYLSKNKAVLGRHGKRKHNVDEELRNAERDFHGIVQRDPKDPSAWNGLGNVAIVRGDLDAAEKYARKAITVAPRYRAAKGDLEHIQKLRGPGGPNRAEHGPPSGHRNGAAAGIGESKRGRN